MAFEYRQVPLGQVLRRDTSTLNLPDLPWGSPSPEGPEGRSRISPEDMDAMIASALTLVNKEEMQMTAPDTSKLKGPEKPITPPTKLTDEQKQVLKYQTISEGLQNLASVFPNARQRFGPPPEIGAALGREEVRLERNRAEARQLMNDFAERRREFSNKIEGLQIQFAMDQDERRQGLLIAHQDMIQ